jgi:hypothetical protein
VLFHADLSGRSLGEGRERGGTLRKESKSEPLRYSATSARKIRAELREVDVGSAKTGKRGERHSFLRTLRLLFVFRLANIHVDDITLF